MAVFCSNSLKTILMAMTKMKQEKFLINLYQFLIWILIKASCNVYNYKQMSQNFVSFEIWTEWLWYLNIDQMLILKNYRCTDRTIQMTKHHRNPFNPCLNSNRSQVSEVFRSPSEGLQKSFRRPLEVLQKFFSSPKVQSLKSKKL